MFDKLEKILMPAADKMGKNKVLISIRDGFLVSVPLIIVGSIFLLIANFPIPGWSEFWARIFGEGWENYLGSVSTATFDIISLLTVVGLKIPVCKVGPPAGLAQHVRTSYKHVSSE